MKTVEEFKQYKQKHDWQFWKRIQKILVAEYSLENKHDPWFEYNPYEFISWVENRYGFLIIRDEVGLMTADYFLIDQRKFSLFEIKFS